VTPAASESPVPLRPPATPRGALFVEHTWGNLLFAHWRAGAAAVRPLVPDALELDTWEGAAWVGVVPFLMSGVRARALPAVPGARRFPELNVRTYVRHGGVSGVWFFSLDAASALVVAVGRALWGLPYRRADMKLVLEGDAVRYRSRRAGAGGAPAEYDASYRPTGPARAARAGTLEHWLTERYSLFVVDARSRVRRADIEHEPWDLQDAEADVRLDTMAAAAGLALDGPPSLLLCSRRQPTRAWLPRAVG